jgi:DNA helicase II / ATP-dependent DNA helicase PcrA
MSPPLIPAKNEHPLTDEQQEICSAVGRGMKSTMVIAYAGTGKTSTVEAAAKRVKEPALALAFNKKITEELSKRLPPNFSVKSLNGAGHLAWIKTLDGASIKVDAQKLGKLVTSIAQENSIRLTSWQWDAVRSTVSAAMRVGISPDDIGKPLISDTYENWMDIIDSPTQDDIPLIQDLAHQVLEANIQLARSGHISFDDQIYCPVILGGRWLQYPRVFIDEAQDLSPLNHVQLGLCTRDDGLIGAVGDPKQAIYQFRGADASSMTNMRRLRMEWDDLKLTLTFRCPKIVVDRQQEHAPGYRAYEKNQTGRFVMPTDYEAGTHEYIWGWEWLKARMAEIPNELIPHARTSPPIAILCRNNAPLLSLAFKLIRSGVGCQMQGRDIGRGLVLLSKKISDDDELSIVKFTAKLNEWLEHETQLAHINQKPERAAKLQDQGECLIATIEGAQPSTAGDLRKVLERLFSREGNPIVLSSCHRAKGLEWPCVVHLDPWRIPSKHAQMANLMGDPKPLEQEYNLGYVTETRTKHTLINADLEQFR